MGWTRRKNTKKLIHFWSEGLPSKVKEVLVEETLIKRPSNISGARLWWGECILYTNFFLSK